VRAIGTFSFCPHGQLTALPLAVAGAESVRLQATHLNDSFG